MRDYAAGMEFSEDIRSGWRDGVVGVWEWGDFQSVDLTDNVGSKGMVGGGGGGLVGGY